MDVKFEQSTHQVKPSFSARVKEVAPQLDVQFGKKEDKDKGDRFFKTEKGWWIALPPTRG